MNQKTAIVLVGHGAVPTDFPKERLRRFMTLDRDPAGAASRECQELETEIRRWPRTSKTDPYQTGLKALADALRRAVKARGIPVYEAYNEFCAPTVEEAVAEAVSHGAAKVVVVPTMATRGGSHSEVEIPGIIQSLRLLYPNASILYAWPFDLDNFARMLTLEIDRVLTASVLPSV